MTNVKHCSKCGQLHDRPHQGYCLECHAAYMRATRPKYNELTELQRLVDKCRSYANVYRRRGKLTPEPCVKCGEAKVEMHHANYTQPLIVVWLCRPCHLKHHKRD